MKKIFVIMGFVFASMPMAVMPVQKWVLIKSIKDEHIPLLFNRMPSLRDYEENNFSINLKKEDAENKIESEDIKEIQNNKREELVIQIDDVGSKKREPSCFSRKNTCMFFSAALCGSGATACLVFCGFFAGWSICSVLQYSDCYAWWHHIT